MSASGLLPTPSPEPEFLRLQRSRLAIAVRKAVHQSGVRLCSVGLLAAGVAGFNGYAHADSFPAEFELSTLAAGDGSEGFVLTSINATDVFGFSGTSAGDVNGDGIDDLIIGAYRGFPPGSSAAGKSYVVFGRSTPFEAEFNVLSLVSAGGSAGFILNGIDAFDRSGFEVNAAGDVNGDGIDDLIIGGAYASPNGEENAGESYVVFGSQASFPAMFELSSLAAGNGSTGFVLNGIDSNDRSGISVSSAGDINGDGIGDLAIGAHRAQPGGRSSAGETYVVFGRTTGFPAEFELSVLATGDGTEGFVLNGDDSGDLSGRSVSFAGDINGDGIDDLIIGAPFAEPNGNYSGEAYVVFGRTTGFPAEFELSDISTGDGSTGFIVNSVENYDQCGRSVSTAGDINGDGLDDLVIGCSNTGFGPGQTFVVFGRTAGFPAVLDPSGLALGDENFGFTLLGIDEDDFAGRSVDAAGDVNGDGVDDLIIGAPLASPNEKDGAGESYVVFGRTTGFPLRFELADLAAGDGSMGFVLNGINASDESGISVSGASDINFDGVDDIIIGARGAPNGAGSDGASYVVFGRANTVDTDGDGVGDAMDNCTLVMNSDQRDTNGDGFGNACDPDINNDGIVNFADLSAWIPVFGMPNTGDEDFNGDGAANFIDFGLFSQYFLQAPGPSGLADLQTSGSSTGKPDTD